MRTKFFVLLLLVISLSASAQAQLFKGIYRIIPKTAVAAKAAQSLAHQQQVLQQQNRLASQQLQRLNQQQVLQTQLQHSQQTVLPVPLARKADCLVSQDVVLPLKQVIPHFDDVVRTELLPYDEECSKLLDGGMDLDARLGAPKLRPAEYGHAEVDGGRVHGIEPAVKFKLSCNPSLLCKEYHVEGKLLKDICKFSQPAASHELPEHKNEQLDPMRRNPISGPVVGLGHKTLEIPLWQKTGNLSENVLSKMHIYPKFDLGAKVRFSKVRQGF